MSYQILSQLSGPRIDTDLIPKSVQAGINAGNSQKTKTQAIADGILEGVNAGQKLYQNQQQITLNDQRIEANDIDIANAPLDRELKQTELEARKTNINAAKQKQQQEQQKVQRENEFLTTFQSLSSNPQAQAQLLSSGQYQDVFANDPTLHKQVINTAHASGAIDDRTAAAYRGQAMKKETSDFYQKEAAEAMQKFEGARQKLSSHGALTDAAAKLNTTIDAVANRVDFLPADQYQVQGGKVIEKQDDGTGALPLPGGSESQGYLMRNRDTGEYVGTAPKETYQDIQSYKYNKGVMDGSFAAADIQKGYRDLGLDQNGNPKRESSTQSQQQTQTQTRRQPEPKQPKGFERIKSLQEEVPVTDSPEFKEAVAEQAGITPEAVETNEPIIKEYHDALLDKVKKDVSNPSGFFTGLFTTPEEDVRVEKTRADFAQVLSQDLMEKSLNTQAGRDLYGEDAVNRYNSQIDTFYEGDTANPAGQAPNGNSLQRLSTRNALIDGEVYGYSKARSPSHLFYLMNRDKIDNRVQQYERQALQKFTNLYRGPMDVQTQGNEKSLERLQGSKGATIEPIQEVGRPTQGKSQQGEVVKPSNRSKELVKEFEGLELEKYPDPNDSDTIGWGHTGEGVRKGVITEEEAEQYLEQDMQVAADAVLRNVNVPLSQNQLDALTSFVFNVGEGQFKSSTLLRKLNSGDYNAAAGQFKRWKYDDGKVKRGLVRRRKAEEQLFLA